ncbi:MAG: SAM-dependent methyltransferase [Oscillospiraceae bacterium]|nr:SAM-dependent methyltransferase [Oscillospiraceae bacterium]
MLSARLQACASFVTQGGRICDVGTDHALLPVWLVEQGIAAEAIAADIGSGPLQAAERTIAAHGLTGRIRTILSDGLANIPEREVTDIIIAGMGGETMVHILASAPFPLDGKRLILQPMTKAEILRQWLYSHGFVIREECCAREDNRLYAVMLAEYTGACYKIALWALRIGAMDLTDPDCLAYAEQQLARLTRRSEAMRRAGTPDGAAEEMAEALRERLEEFR